MAHESVLEIIAYGAWNGGTPVDNSIFENMGMFFKGGRPVTHETIEERVGVRIRMAARADERIGVIALKDLFESSDLDPSRVKLLIGATNVGEDKYDPGPLIRHPFDIIRRDCPDAIVLDLYAGCPGFNVAAETAFMLSLGGVLKRGDLSVIVGAENIHRAKAFRPLDTSNIIFGDDALATALETKATVRPNGQYRAETATLNVGEDFVSGIAHALLEVGRGERLGGIIVDNQLGKIQHKIPATAARVQSRLVELMYPGEASEGTLTRFREAIAFYDRHVNSFAFDIMTLAKDPQVVRTLGRAYVESGKYNPVGSVYVGPDLRAEITLHKGQGHVLERPRYGIVDTLTRTHGCFADYIRVMPEDGEVFAEIDGKGVFLHATRGASAHLSDLLSKNGLTMDDIDLLIEHQANFAMIPMTMERVLENGEPDAKAAAREYIAKKMITNIHERGNCSVVCMQRLPYDLMRGVLKEDNIQGYAVNQNLDRLRQATLILCDSVGSGMTRSSLLQRKPNAG